MEGLWTLMETWSPFGQGFFLVLIASLVLGTIRECMRHLAVMMRGWPNQSEPDPLEIILDQCEGVEVEVEYDEDDNIIVTRLDHE